VTTARPTTPESAVVEALASGSKLTGAEIAAATGLGRSTVGKPLVALERRGMVRRDPGGRDGRRRLPDRWWAAQTDHGVSSPSSPAQRLRPGQLDGLVLDYLNSKGAAMGATVVAKALGRSGGAVGNCLVRLAAAGRVRKVGDKPRRYTSTTSTTRKGARAARPRDETS
jgi:DNA-binding IclR family transcriptional regulator